MDKDDIRKKWETAGLLEGLSNTSNSPAGNIVFSKIIGTEPKEHVEKRIRYDKMRRLFGDDEFFKIVDKKTYEDFINEDFINEEFFKPKTIAHDLVAVKPLSAPSNSLFYIDYKYGDE